MAWLDGLDPRGHPITPPPAEGDTEVSGYAVLGIAYASGHQHYVAEYSADEHRLVWVLEGPTAVLTDAYTGELVAHHGGGRSVGGPTWTALVDESMTQGQLAPAFVPDKFADRIPPLKLYTSGHSGVMGRVEVIQRLQTSGGHPGPPPEGGVEAAATKSVPYSATYVFWGTLPEEQPVPPEHDAAYATAEQHGDDGAEQESQPA
jgi:hypothetical protein